MLAGIGILVGFVVLMLGLAIADAYDNRDCPDDEDFV